MNRKLVTAVCLALCASVLFACAKKLTPTPEQAATTPTPSLVVQQTPTAVVHVATPTPGATQTALGQTNAPDTQTAPAPTGEQTSDPALPAQPGEPTSPPVGSSAAPPPPPAGRTATPLPGNPSVPGTATPSTRPSNQPAQPAAHPTFNPHALARLQSETLSDWGLRSTYNRVVDDVMAYYGTTSGKSATLPASRYGVPASELLKVVQCFRNYHVFRNFIADNPRVSGGNVVFTYRFASTEHKNRVAAFPAVFNEWCREYVPNSANTLDRLIAVHIYQSNLRLSGLQYAEPQDMPYHDAYTCLVPILTNPADRQVSKLGTCCSFAESEVFMLVQLGVEAYTGGTGRSDGDMATYDHGGHGFFVVVWQGKYYYFDSSNEGRLSRNNYGGLATFMLTETQARNDSQTLNTSTDGVYIGFAPFEVIRAPLVSARGEDPFPMLRNWAASPTWTPSAALEKYTITFSASGHWMEYLGKDGRRYRFSTVPVNGVYTSTLVS